MAILRTAKALIKAMCGVKLTEKSSQEFTNLMDLEDALNGSARQVECDGMGTFRGIVMR